MVHSTSTCCALVPPCRYIGPNGGKGIMVAQYKDTRDLVEDQNGNPVAWSRA